MAIKQRIPRVPTRIDEFDVALLRRANAYEFTEGKPFNMLKPTPAGLEFAAFYCLHIKGGARNASVVFGRRIRKGIEVGALNPSNTFVYGQNGVNLYVPVGYRFKEVLPSTEEYKRLNRQLPQL
jgi:hypothetical protein